MSRSSRFISLLCLVALLIGCSGPTDSRDVGTPPASLPPAIATLTSTATPPASPPDGTVVPTATPVIASTASAVPSSPPVVTPTPTASPPQSTSTPSPFPVVTATPTISPPAANAPPDQQVDLPDVDVHYHLTIGDLRVADGYVRASERITIREFRGQPPERMYLQVVPAHYGFFTLLSLSINGVDVQPEVLNDGVTLALDLPPNVVAPLIIALEFTLTVGDDPTGWAGTMLDGSILRLGYWFPILSTDHGFSDIFDPSYTATADFDVDVSLDPALEIAHTGQLVDRVVGADGRHTLSLRARRVRDFAIVVSAEFAVDELTSASGVPIRLYTTTADPDTRQRILHTAADALDRLSVLIGPYPYETFTIVDAGPSMPGGLEFPMLIYINPGYPTLDRLLYHELAHQWLYAIMGTRSLHDGWIDEGGAEFLERGLPSDFTEVPAIPSGGYRYPLDSTYLELTGANWSDAYYAIYEQGARFYYAVLESMGWEPFWAAMRELYESFRFGIVTAWDLLHIWQQHSPSDLRSIYAEYFRYEWLDRLPAPGGT